MTGADPASGQGVAAAVIIGCGYLGIRTAHALTGLGVSVSATTLTDRNWPLLQEMGVAVYPFDIETSAWPAELSSAEALAAVDVYFMLTPRSMASVLAPGDGYDRFLDMMSSRPFRRALLVSSTAAFGEHGEAKVAAETPVAPVDERGRRVVEIERRWLQTGERFSVCRLAGLYGPGRVIGERQLRAGNALPGPADRWLNLIHVDDAARLLIACCASPQVHRIELGSDGAPVRRQTYYELLAEMLGTAPPEFKRDGSGRAASRRCDPSSTMQRTGWRPRYTDYRQGLSASLAAPGAE